MLSTGKPTVNTIRAAIIQFDIRRDDVESNLSMVKRRIYSLAKQNVQLVLLPEMWAPGFAHEGLKGLSETTPGVLEHLSGIAKNLN